MFNTWSFLKLNENIVLIFQMKTFNAKFTKKKGNKMRGIKRNMLINMTISESASQNQNLIFILVQEWKVA